MHDNLGFPQQHNDSVQRLASYMGPKRVAHTTISSDGLQDELVIGGVGVFGNLGERKVNLRSGVVGRGEYLVRNVRSKGRGQDRRNVKPKVLESVCHIWNDAQPDEDTNSRETIPNTFLE